MMAVSVKLEQIASIKFALLEMYVKATALVKLLHLLILVNALLILNVLQDIALLLILVRIPAHQLTESVLMVKDVIAQDQLIAFQALAMLKYVLLTVQLQLHLLIIATAKVILNA